MRALVVPTLLTCGPWLLSTGALAQTFAQQKRKRLRASALWMVGGAWLVTTYAASVFIRYMLTPPPGSPPPWEDPETLNLAMLFFLAPVGTALAVAAKTKGASWLSLIALVVAMVVLFAVGVMETVSV